MNSFMKYSAMMLIISTAGTNVAHATGPYVSLNVSNANLEHSIERNIGNATLPVQDTSGFTTASDSGIGGGAAVGYSFDLPNNFFVGAEGFYNQENASTKNINSVLVTDIDLDATYGARFIAGAHVTDKFSLYTHAGATVVDFDVRNSYTFAPPVRTTSEREVGFSYGVGADMKINNKMSVFTEYTQINDVSFTPLPEVAGNTGRLNQNELNISKLSLGVKYAF